MSWLGEGTYSLNVFYNCPVGVKREKKKEKDLLCLDETGTSFVGMAWVNNR